MTQFARPASDITTANWTTTPLFSKLNDQSDATVVRPNNGITTACEVKLGAVTDPAVSTGHIVKVHAKATGSSAGEQQTVDLYQGGTAIATAIITGTVSRTAQTEYTGTLSGVQADAITDYTDLRIRLRMSTGAATEFIEYGEAWLEVPDPPATPKSGSDSAAGDDVSALSVPPMAVGEAGVGSDVLDLARPTSDAGIAADVSAVSVPISVSDAGSGADSSSLITPAAGTRVIVVMVGA